MGDASGSLQMTVQELVEPGEKPPSFLPSLSFSLERPVWQCAVGGRLCKTWIERLCGYARYEKHQADVAKRVQQQQWSHRCSE